MVCSKLPDALSVALVATTDLCFEYRASSRSWPTCNGAPLTKTSEERADCLTQYTDSSEGLETNSPVRERSSLMLSPTAARSDISDSTSDMPSESIPSIAVTSADTARFRLPSTISRFSQDLSTVRQSGLSRTSSVIRFSGSNADDRGLDGNSVAEIDKLNSAAASRSLGIRSKVSELASSTDSRLDCATSILCTAALHRFRSPRSPASSAVRSSTSLALTSNPSCLVATSSSWCASSMIRMSYGGIALPPATKSELSSA